MDMVKIKRRNENRHRTEDKSTKQQDFEDMGVKYYMLKFMTQTLNILGWLRGGYNTISVTFTE